MVLLFPTKNMLTTEQKLQAIIKAQMRVEYDKWEFVVTNESYIQKNGLLIVQTSPQQTISPLEILLDTDGCKAAYGIDGDVDRCIFRYEVDIDDYVVTSVEPFWSYTSRQILEAWNSGEGNNYVEAINVAFSLLKDE